MQLSSETILTENPMGGKRSIRNKVIWGKLLFVADRKGAKEASFNGYLSSETFFPRSGKRNFSYPGPGPDPMKIFLSEFTLCWN